MKTKDEWEIIHEQIAAQHAAIDQMLIDYRAQYGDIAIVLIYDEPECAACPWRGVQIAPYTGKGGGVRLSYFDQNGFSGHGVYKDAHEAIVQSGRYDWRPDPDFLDRLAATDERFQRGNAYTLALEELRARQYEDKTPYDEAWQQECALREQYYPSTEKDKA